MNAFTSLQQAVITQLGYSWNNPCQELVDTLEDISKYGISGGFSGFIYYTETFEFCVEHGPEILKALKALANDLGMSTIELVRSFACIDSDIEEEHILDAFFVCKYRTETENIEDDGRMVCNALAWFAAEEVARELEDNIEIEEEEA